MLMASTFEKAKRRYKITKKSAALLAGSFLFGLFTLLLMNTMANISSYWSVGTTLEPLPDFTFEVFSEQGSRTLVDYLMNSLIAITMLCILIRRNAIEIYFRFFVCMMIAYLLRMTTVSFTNLPSPNSTCIKIVKNMLTTFTYERCGDLIFSGHSLIVMVCALIWSSYDLLLNKNLSRLGCVSAWAVSFTIFMLILTTRNHYTVDVLLSIYVTGSIWIIYGFVWEKYLAKEDIFECFIIEDHQ